MVEVEVTVDVSEAVGTGESLRTATTGRDVVARIRRRGLAAGLGPCEPAAGVAMGQSFGASC